MFGSVFKILKQLAFVPLIITGLVVLGGAINSYIGTSPINLVYFFAILRRFIFVFDFMLDIPTLLLLVGFSLLVEAAYWALRGILFFSFLFK